MKTDLATAIIAAIIGVAAAYVVTAKVILGEPAAVVVKSLEEPASADLTEPSAEIFNYRALNPTVETYVDCSDYDASGSCIIEGQ